ncbi:High mobility group [Heracleum sosnowskyi]|uniref:High mobility group n=1 Tax=Heracleum sosnowskyi TaxID=360622 RepID=A0AAD8JA88_9APIA|nr:High mobility group [Heracleum sosnowskyi]
MKGGRSKAGSKNDDKLSVKQKKVKKVKDPNKPKRPPSAFFVFMEGFRKQFKEKNPAVKGVAAIGKAGGDRWRAMSDEDKAEFVTIAEQRKKDYEKKMQAYEKKQARENEEEESDKSKSEVNDDDDEGSDEEEDDD